jgi:hypothetical protein
MARQRRHNLEGPGRPFVVTRALVAFGVLVASFALLPATMAAAASSKVGVFVDQPTTTLPPPTTAPPVTAPGTTAAPAAPAVTTTVAPTTAAVTVPATAPATTSPQETLPDVLPPQQPADAPAKSSGVFGGMKSAAKTTKRLVGEVLSGTPVADAAEAILPAKVADVVVPAVRTASTFVFPIGLAGSVVAFLALQQRIDASDPKLSAAPLAHDDDVVKFL